MVSFTEYLVGRQTGLYLPPMQPTSTVVLNRKSQEPKKTTLFDTTVSEFWKEWARQAARKGFQGG
jgi:hypothetical protein